MIRWHAFPSVRAGARLISLMLLASALIVGVSCQGGRSSRVDIPVHVGSQGLVFGFIEKAPPARVFEDMEVPVILEVRNQGAFDARSVSWILSADTGVFEFTGQSEGSLSVEGRSKANPVPGRELIEAKMRSLELDPQRQTHDGQVIATVCYQYQTDAGLNVCVDTDPLDLAKRRKVCSVRAVSGGGGQGGPVAVSRVEPNMVPDGEWVLPEFTIDISNAASGRIVDPKRTSLACQPLVSYPDLFDVVEVSARLTDTPLDCDRRIRLENGRGQVTCRATEGISRALGAYMSPLSITLKYGYTQSVAVPVRVERKDAASYVQ